MFLSKNRWKNFAVSKKCSNFALEKKRGLDLPASLSTYWLGYGVMVTLQILVLPFLVRIRVSQQKKRLCQNSNWHSLFFSLHIVKHCYLELRFQKTSIKMNKSVKCFCVSRICFIFLIKEHWYWALDGISR